MHADVETLLVLQSEDEVLEALVSRFEALTPRLQALDVERERAVKRLAQAGSSLEQEERKRRELEQLVSEHRQRNERNLAQLDLVKRMREATAAQSQVDTGRRMLQDGENELRVLTARLAEVRRNIAEQQQALEALDLSQAETRQSIGTERSTLEREIGTARAQRESVAERVPQTLRGKYDRIRARRRAQAVFSLASGACSACDTSVPIQRRNVMAASGTIELCEACGVLLYAAE